MDVRRLLRGGLFGALCAPAEIPADLCASRRRALRGLRHDGKGNAAAAGALLFRRGGGRLLSSGFRQAILFVIRFTVPNKDDSHTFLHFSCMVFIYKRALTVYHIFCPKETA